MESNSRLTLNLQYPNIAQVAYAMQGDRLSRAVVADLIDGSTPWTPPAGAYGLITASKPDGTFAVYDTLEDGSPAIVIDGSTVTLYLAEQVLADAGAVKMSVAFFTSAGARLTTFRWTEVVAPEAVLDRVVSGNYISVFTATMDQIADDIEEAQTILDAIKAAYGAPLTANTAAAMTDTTRIYVYTGTTTDTLTNGHWYYYDGTAWADGGIYNSTTFETDTTLTIAGAAADAKAAGDAVGDLKRVLSDVTYNVFDDSKLTATGITKANGVFSGAASRFAAAFSTSDDCIPVSCEEATVYTFSLKGFTGGESGTTGQGFKVTAFYSDGTSGTLCSLPNATTTETLFSGQSTSGKTLVGIGFTYGSLSGNVWNISELMLAKGSTQLAYIPHVTALDRIARINIAEVSEHLETIDDEISDLYSVTNTTTPLLKDAPIYATATSAGDSYISNRTIPAGAKITSVSLVAGGDNTSTAFIYLIDKSTSKVIYKKPVTIATGSNSIVVNYTVPADCYIGFKGTRVMVRTYNDYTGYEDYTLSTDGLYQPASASMEVGDTVTINKVNSKAYLFELQFSWTLITGLIQELQDEMQEVVIPYVLNNGNLLRYKPVSGNYGLVGRWYTYNDKPCTNNDGSQIFVRTKGATTLTIDLQQITALTKTPYFAYSIDGGPYTRQLITNTSISLTSGEHIVRIVIDGMTEVESGVASKWAGTLGVYLNSISVNTGTVEGFLPTNRMGAFFGDSICEGINALGTGANSDVNSATGSFPFFCCTELEAVPYMVGYGGTGVVVTGSFHNFGDAIDYYKNGSPVESFAVDFIVIEHGINDNINANPVSPSDFIAEYEVDINKLRVKFGAVPIFCVVPFKNQAYSEQIESMCDDYSNCYFISTYGWGGATVDGTHLSAAGAENNGKILASKILEVLGKPFFMN